MQEVKEQEETQSAPKGKWAWASKELKVAAVIVVGELARWIFGFDYTEWLELVIDMDWNEIKPLLFPLIFAVLRWLYTDEPIKGLGASELLKSIMKKLPNKNKKLNQQN